MAGGTAYLLILHSRDTNFYFVYVYGTAFYASRLWVGFFVYILGLVGYRVCGRFWDDTSLIAVVPKS